MTKIISEINLPSHDGWCRYGNEEKDIITSVTKSDSSDCYEECKATNGCVAFAYEDPAFAYSTNCDFYRNGPYTHGTGREHTKCYVLPTGRSLLSYNLNVNIYELMQQRIHSG